jgi:hypothetical protein
LVLKLNKIKEVRFMANEKIKWETPELVNLSKNVTHGECAVGGGDLGACAPGASDLTGCGVGNVNNGLGCGTGNTAVACVAGTTG